MKLKKSCFKIKENFVNYTKRIIWRKSVSWNAFSRGEKKTALMFCVILHRMRNVFWFFGDKFVKSFFTFFRLL